MPTYSQNGSARTSSESRNLVRKFLVDYLTIFVNELFILYLVGSSVKGLLAGLIIGFFARKVKSLKSGLIFGGAVGLVLAFIIAAMPDPSGKYYWLQIMIPGTIVGIILGYVTQKYGKEPKPATAN